jgi:hypothetical protein
MRLPLVLLVLCLTSSCTVQTSLVLQADGSAQATAVLKVSPEAQAAWSSLRELDRTLPADPLEPTLLRQGLGPQSRVTKSATETHIELPIAHLSRFLSGWSSQGDVWEGSIDRTTVRRWVALSAWGDSPALDSLLPTGKDSVTEAEYRDLLLYLLGPSVSEATGRALLQGSTVQLTLIAPRTVASAPGSLSVTDRTVVYRWPLTRLLTLETPLRLRLEFRGENP